MRWNQQWWNHQGAVELDKVRWNQQQPHSKSSTVRRKAAECVNLIPEKSTILCRPVGPTRLQWTDCTVHDVVGDQCALFALYALYALCALCALVHLCTVMCTVCTVCTVHCAAGRSSRLARHLRTTKLLLPVFFCHRLQHCYPRYHFKYILFQPKSTFAFS